MSILNGLEPKQVLTYFEEITKIPHGSQNVKAISDYLVAFANGHSLQVEQDEALNVIIRKPASKGAEEQPGVILQGHMDMVTVKDRDCEKNLEQDGLDLCLEGDWLSAKGTSLGADNGIAVAYMLAVLADSTLIHPAIEAVFTTDEEIGLLGAAALDTSSLMGKYFLNMDSEDEGVFTVSCAGGASATCHLPIYKLQKKGQVLEVTLTGLAGGHSGVEIGKGRKNSNFVMGRLLNLLRKTVEFDLISIDGGEKDNAIAKETTACLLVQEDELKQAVEKLPTIFSILREEAKINDPDMQLLIEKQGEQTVGVFDSAGKEAIFVLLNLLPQGVIRKNPNMPELIQTSLNMGVLKTLEREVNMTFSVRSSCASEKEDLIERLSLLTEFANGYVTIQGEYPGWEFNPDSKLLRIMEEIYEKQYGEKPVVEAIHAGLECGIFASKMEGLDAISFGPQMMDVHTTMERISISSVERTYKLLKSTLEYLAG